MSNITRNNVIKKTYIFFEFPIKIMMYLLKLLFYQNLIVILKLFILKLIVNQNLIVTFIIQAISESIWDEQHNLIRKKGGTLWYIWVASMETLSEAYHVRTDSQLSSFPFPTPSTFSSANQTVFIHARARVSVCPRDKKRKKKGFSDRNKPLLCPKPELLHNKARGRLQAQRRRYGVGGFLLLKPTQLFPANLNPCKTYSKFDTSSSRTNDWFKNEMYKKCITDIWRCLFCTFVVSRGGQNTSSATAAI